MPPSAPEALSLRYPYVCLDVWGVLFDGQRVFADGQGFVERLLARQAGLLVFSNTPSTAECLRAELAGWGLPVERFLAIHSAGSQFLERLRAEPERYGAGRAKTYFYVGPPEREATLRETQLRACESAEEADLLVIAGALPGIEDRQHYARLLLPAVRRGVHACCINPDYAALVGEATLAYCGRFVADVYRALGGVVHDFGKPHLDFYRAVLARHDVDPRSCLFVGDDLATDIYAGALLGADTVLLQRGLTRHLLGSDDEARFREHFAFHRLSPTYLVRSLHGV